MLCRAGFPGRMGTVQISEQTTPILTNNNSDISVAASNQPPPALTNNNSDITVN